MFVKAHLILMKTSNSSAVINPPSLLRALAAGFNAITEHIYLILFPIGLDLLIWFGPRMKLMELISQMVDDFTLQSQILAPDIETTEMLNVAQEMWLTVGERFNLMIFLRSYPVGIPSLMASIIPADNPLGTPGQLQINSFFVVVGVFLLLGLIGLFLGTLFYIFVSQVGLNGQVRWLQGLREWPSLSVQVVILAIFFIVLLVGVSIPASCAISLATLSNLAFGQCGILIYGGLLIWIIFPLLFSAHGIFVARDKAWNSIKKSILITRMTLPTTTIFFIAVILLSQGFNYLWRIPPENSWLMLIGLAGHGFVTTGLLSSSFVYYRDADTYVSGLQEKNDLIRNSDVKPEKPL